MKHQRRALRIIFLFLSFFFVFLLFSCLWVKKHFGSISFEEILFTVSSPTGSTESSILESFILESVLASITVFSLAAFIFLTTRRLLSSHDIVVTLRCFSIKKSFLFPGHKTLRFLKFLLSIVIIFIPFFCGSFIGLFDYIRQTRNESSFIADNYVDPAQTKLTFPDRKRNLIYIYAESLESSYFSKELGGIEDVNLLEGLTSLTADNLNFSNSESFGGGTVVEGSDYTTGALVSQMLGLPNKVSFESFSAATFHKEFLPSAIGLGNILQENGYSQHFLIGSDKRFGNRDLLFKDHGDYDIYDYYSAIEEGRVPSDYYVWWGIEDGKLFNIAKEQLKDISKSDKPFNYTILTTNTHHFEGYQEEDCKASFEDKYSNAIYCSAFQISDFVNWAKKQPFYQNTTIIISGDHFTMNNSHFSSNASVEDRRIYNLFINAPTKAPNSKNRDFLTIDMFPTTLAALGVKIDGDRLGLGTNLFSSKKTLLEEYGYSYINAEVSKYSSFYNEKFF